MNNKKVLSAAILFILTKAVFGIEVESNNDSSQANKLGKENVGKLNRASDVDFFAIDSCVKDDKKQCIKYTAADEKLNPANKAGTDKRREEISLSFTCNNRSAATNTTGWFVGIHDSNGELQETYPVKPDDCIISDNTLGSFNFRFSSLESPNYYVSVVSDCAAPIYNSVTDPKDSTKTIVNVNKFVMAMTAKQTDIDAAKAEFMTAQKAVDSAKNDLSKASFAVINSNANIKNLIDALALTNDITSLASTTLTPATNLSAAMSTAKAIEIAAYAMQFSIYTYGQFLLAEAAAKDPAIAKAIENADAVLNSATKAAEQAAIDVENIKTAINDAKTDLNNANSAVKDATKAVSDTKKVLRAAVTDIAKLDAQDDWNIAKDTLNAANNAKTAAETVKANAETAKVYLDAAKKSADNAKTIAENNLKKANNAKTVADNALADAKAKDDETKAKLTDSLTALADAVKSLNDTVKANIDAANTAQNLGKHFDEACKDNYNVGIYTIKDNPDNETKRLEDITSKAQKNLGLEQSGQISSIDDMDIYVVDSDGIAAVPLLFTCTAMALRQTNDWKVSIYNDTNGLVSSTLINGSSCGSVFIGDKGGQSLKLPKGSQRYYLAVESACASSTRKDCVVDTSEYSLLRDVDKVYSGKLTVANTTIKATGADLKLTNCGLNNNAVIAIHAENVDLADAAKLAKGKLPVNVQIGSTACRILTPELSIKNAIIGSVAESSTIIDSASKTKDSATITLGDCGASNSKVTLTGSRLDLVNFNPNDEKESVVIPIKVNIGDFHCETKDVFTIGSTTAGTTYSNVAVVENVTVADTPVTTPQDPIITALASATNIGISQTNKLKSTTDVHTYYVETGIKADANFEFSCPNSVRFNNDWKLSIYDNAKTLKSSQLINGSDCGTGKAGDNGTFSFSLAKTAARTYVVVTSACADGDKSCTVDKSSYEITRILPTTSSASSSSASTATTSTIIAPCFHGSCDTVTESDFPVFGGK